MRSGFPSARTHDLCYVDCFTFLGPDSPLFVSRTAGSTFTDFYSFSIDPTNLLRSIPIIRLRPDRATSRQ